MHIFLIAAGGFLVLDTVFLSMVSNGHLGTVLPAIMGAPMLLAGIFKSCLFPWFHTPFGRWIKTILIIIYAAAAVFFCVMGAILSSAAHKKAEYNRDVLIVLGCAVRGDKVSLTLKYRLDAALEYLSHSPDTHVIVTGGKGDGENLSEARAMKNYLTANGIDPGRITMEDRSTSTWENFKFTREIMDKRFPDSSVAFVTTAFHVYRSGRVALMNGIEAEGYAAKDLWYAAPNNYMRESIAITLYKIRGLLI
ncbi:MAG: YdcF family protein [Clostridia bacterium]|nr:YdcF family protein [Clostridia bacterium]